MCLMNQLPLVFEQVNAAHKICHYDLCEEIIDDRIGKVVPMDVNYVEKVENEVKTWVQD